VVEVTPADARRWLGVNLSPQEMAALLSSLQFEVQIYGDIVRAKTPDHRLDIGTGIIGKADLMEEIARIYGYDRIPETRLADPLPPQQGNPSLEYEERLRDLLVGQGLQEVVTHRLTNPEKEKRLQPPGEPSGEDPYLYLYNPISSDRSVLRRSLLASVLDVIERNARIRPSQALFEIAPTFLAKEQIAGQTGDDLLPEEDQRLVIALTGPRAETGWQMDQAGPMDFYDLKGVLEAVFSGLHLKAVSYTPDSHPSFHPGKCAGVQINGIAAGIMGELHPLVHKNFDFNETPVLACDLSLAVLLEAVPTVYPVSAVPAFPPMLEDLALVVDETVPAAEVAAAIWAAGGSTVVDVRLFDLYRGAQIGEGKKSLAYSLTYQAPNRTLTDDEVSKLRNKIIRRLEETLGAKLRS
jgi:phenylalanyl-tRNA synthetase beta chain